MKIAAEKRIEIITIRLNRIEDESVIRNFFFEILEGAGSSWEENHSLEICLNENVENEWSIHFYNPVVECNGKSSLAETIMEILRPFGLVHHAAWKFFGV